MAVKKIIELNPLVLQSLTDLYETSANGTGSFKETRQQMLNFMTANILPTMQEVYDNSSTGNVDLSAGKHQGYSGTDAGFYLPSMTSAQFDAIINPPNGLMGWANDIDRITLNKGTPGAPVYESVAYLSDIDAITTDGAIGEAYFTDNITETVISAPNTPVLINGTFISGSNNTNFSQSNGRLTNTGTKAFVVEVSVSMSAYFAGGATGLINVYVYKGGSSEPNLIQQYSIDGVSSTPKPLPITGTVLLNPSEYIEPFVANVDGTDNIIVKSINFNAITIGGAGDAGNLTWEQTYTNGDGTVTQTVGKPLGLNSTDIAITPTFQSNQLDIPSALNPLGIYKFLSVSDLNNPVEYAKIEVICLNSTDGSESGRMNLSAKEINTSYQNFTVATFGTNYTLGACLTPTTSYTFGNYSSVIQTLDGSQTVLANTLEIGQSVEIVMTFNINPVNPSVINIGGNFRFIFGSLIFQAPDGTNDIILTNAASRTGELRYTVTRIDATTVQANIYGTYTNTSIQMMSLYANATVLGGPTYPYNAALDALMDIEWRPLTGNVSNYLTVVARNLRIVQFS